MARSQTRCRWKPFANMKNTGPILPWYKRFAYWQREKSRALRRRQQTACDGFLNARGSARQRLNMLYQENPNVTDDINTRRAFLESDTFDQLVDKAIALDPNIARPPKTGTTDMAPWHDHAYFSVKKILDALPDGPFDIMILVPFGKLGGADFVAGILAKTLSANARVLIIRTDAADWDRPDWYPPQVPAIDISADVKTLHEAPRALYTVIQSVNPKAIFNVNSRLGFDCFQKYGARLARDHKLFCYYFCADQTPDGQDVGYPVWFAADIIPNLEAALVDNVALATTLKQRYAVPPHYAKRICTMYTPTLSSSFEPAVVDAQVASSQTRSRPRLLWAGRLDRQKRFDLLVEIAKALPEIDFVAWGKSVLGSSKATSKTPENLKLNPPFTALDTLPLQDCDGWIYTSAWDGLPTLLIELAARGMPIVASAVGGVPELIDDTTGWPVEDWENPQAYIRAIHDMLADPETRSRRARHLQKRAEENHKPKDYQVRLTELVSVSDPADMEPSAQEASGI